MNKCDVKMMDITCQSENDKEYRGGNCEDYDVNDGKMVSIKRAKENDPMFKGFVESE
jgi:hypothetical protein